MATLQDLQELGNEVRSAEQTLESLRHQRDEMIRQIRRSTSHTVPEIADAAGVSPATVKAVIRGIR